MIGLIKRLVPAPVKQRIKAALGMAPSRLNPEWEVLTPIGPVLAPHVMLDIGAHHGWFFHCWLDWCPQAQVHAFEPFPASFDICKGLYGNDPRVHLNQMGVGSAVGQLELNAFADSPVSNSFLATDTKAWNDLKYSTGAASRVSVPVTTVDDYVAKNGIGRIHLVKIDVQGFELHVLRGAEKSLSQIDHIFVEAGIERLYEGAPIFTEIFEYLSARGFHLMTMRAWHRGNRVLIETDMLFRRNDLAPPVDESVIKTMEQLR